MIHHDIGARFGLITSCEAVVILLFCSQVQYS